MKELREIPGGLWNLPLARGSRLHEIALQPAPKGDTNASWGRREGSV